MLRTSPINIIPNKYIYSIKLSDNIKQKSVLKISYLDQRVYEKHWECNEDSHDSLNPKNTKLIKYPKEHNFKKTVIKASSTYPRCNERMKDNQQVIKKFHVYEMSKPWIKGIFIFKLQTLSAKSVQSILNHQNPHLKSRAKSNAEHGISTQMDDLVPSC